MNPRQARVLEEQVCPKGMFYFTHPKSIPGMEGPGVGNFFRDSVLPGNIVLRSLQYF